MAAAVLAVPPSSQVVLTHAPTARSLAPYLFARRHDGGIRVENDEQGSYTS
jgi:hypothetical protein